MKKVLELAWEKKSAWQKDGIARQWLDWLLYPGSFMQRLKQYSINDARIQVIQQSWQLPGYDERKLLDIYFRTYVWVREVIILSEERYWMYARTVFPKQTLTGQHLQLARLKSRSLGSVLFKDPALQRSEFEIACIKKGMDWHHRMEGYAGRCLPDLWARRSLFSAHSKSLLLMEVFFPAVITL
jgi:chorismate--pyruvate lyase